MKKNPEVDAYIENAQPFAKPILKHLRTVIHKACPEVEESIKWHSPFFSYKGIICFISSFTHHASFGFWKPSLMPGLQKVPQYTSKGMGTFGKLTKVDDLPSDDVIIALIKEAMELNEKGVKVPPKSPRKDWSKK